MRLATYNVEWFTHLFDDRNRLIDDGGWSGRSEVTRAEQIAALGLVFQRLDADAIMVIEGPDINRTRDGDDGPGLGFYMGRTVQVLLNTGNRQFSDVTATHVDKPTGEPGFGGTDWFPWLRVQDIDGDGDLDLFPDNLASGTSAEATGMVYRNDGSGRFTLQWVDVGLR